jgi:hypothetical protein
MSFLALLCDAKCALDAKNKRRLPKFRILGSGDAQGQDLQRAIKWQRFWEILDAN